MASLCNTRFNDQEEEAERLCKEISLGLIALKLLVDKPNHEDVDYYFGKIIDDYCKLTGLDRNELIENLLKQDGKK